MCKKHVKLTWNENTFWNMRKVEQQEQPGNMQ